jgi:hypothetical protein
LNQRDWFATSNVSVRWQRATLVERQVRALAMRGPSLRVLKPIPTFCSWLRWQDV